MDTVGFFLVQHASVHSSDVRGRPVLLRPGPGRALTEDELRLRPAPGVNSIVWLLWHMARVEDASVNLVVADGPQVLDDDWLRRLDVPWRHIGTGMTDDEVSELTRRADVGGRARVPRRGRPAHAGGRPHPGAGGVGRAGRSGPTPRAPPRPARSGRARAGWTGADFTPWQDESRAARLSGAALRHNALHIGEAVTVRGLAGRGPGV